MTNTLDSDKRVCLGVITGSHGVRGQVRVKSFAAEPKDVVAYGPLSDESGARAYELTLTGTAKGVLLARIAGVQDRDEADALRGVELWVDRSKLPNADDGEFYHADLIGLPAVHLDGAPFGTVLALHDFGAGEMIEFDLESGGTAILPFTHDAIPEISAERLVVVTPQTVDAVAEKTDAQDASGKDQSGSDAA
ncbi:MAG: 16S rRNA processing protein RimM [Alphaproteobacteria bacterium]|nr:16S rRNA processing protein RimM [Alphaproteobacteria bacterium]